MSTVPEPAGAVAVIWVAEFTVSVVAAVVPNLTAVTPTKFVPVMVTGVPPAVGPALGLTLVTVGAGGGPPPVALMSTPMPEEVPAGDCVPAGDTAPVTPGSYAARLASLVGT